MQRSDQCPYLGWPWAPLPLGAPVHMEVVVWIRARFLPQIGAFPGIKAWALGPPGRWRVLRGFHLWGEGATPDRISLPWGTWHTALLGTQ